MVGAPFWRGVGWEQSYVSGPEIRSRIRRWYVANATYFLTVVTRDRQPLFADSANLSRLRQVLHNVQELYPFRMYAYVFLPDHFHLLILLTLPTDISKLMQSLQWNYTMTHKRDRGLDGKVSLWQRGFWDHVIRDTLDFERHLNYIHNNPVKHGYVERPGDYPDSSFCEYVKRGWYDEASDPNGAAEYLVSESITPYEPG